LRYFSSFLSPCISDGAFPGRPARPPAGTEGGRAFLARSFFLPPAVSIYPDSSTERRIPQTDIAPEERVGGRFSALLVSAAAAPGNSLS
jgi:hypothetical protein